MLISSSTTFDFHLKIWALVMQNNSVIILSASHPAENKEWPEKWHKSTHAIEVDYQFFPLKYYGWPENS